MKASRTLLREKIMIILYQISLYKKENIEYDINLIIKNAYEIENDYINSIVFGVIKNEEKIDKVINEHLNNWKIDRLGETDKAILRMSVYEMLYYDTPDIVVINEAIELAKQYSDDKVVKMINATLDSIMESENSDEE